jgi:hypothetical protein
MTAWAVRAFNYEHLLVETPAGQRKASLDPYERGGYFLTPDAANLVGKPSYGWDGDRI